MYGRHFRSLLVHHDPFPVYGRLFRSLLVHHGISPVYDNQLLQPSVHHGTLLVYDRLIKLFFRENNHFANKNGGDKPMIRPEMRMVEQLGAWRRVSAPKIIISRLLRNNINLSYYETLF